jgi:hypothetical protein
VAKPAETERRTEVAIDQRRCQRRFSRIAQGKDEGAREISIAKRLATMVAAIVPTATAHRPRGPKAMSAPAATPAAGQNTATPSGVSRARLELRRQDINTADNDGQPAQAQPFSRQISRV